MGRRRFGFGVLVVMFGAGCSLADWDSFTSGSSGDAMNDVPDAAPVEAEARAEDSGADANETPFLTSELIREDEGSFDLTAIGLTDWVEYHRKNSPNRCATCIHLIEDLSTKGTPFEYDDDGRTFRWSNGAPTREGAMTGGLYVDGVGSAFQIAITPDGTSQVATLFIQTFLSAGKVEARLEGTSVPALEPLALALSQKARRYGLKLRFLAPPTAKLRVVYTVAAAGMLEGGEKPNVTVSAITLAPATP